MKLISEEATNVEFLTELMKRLAKSLTSLKVSLCKATLRTATVEFIRENVYLRGFGSFIVKKRAFGELGHPDGPTVNLERVSHMIEELEEVDQNFMGRAKILDTPYGKIVKNLIDEGAQLGVSSRGMGSLKAGRDGVSEVQGDFYLATAADIVADPSAPDAFVAGIMEGKEWIWDNGLLKETQIQEYQIKLLNLQQVFLKRTIKSYKDFIVKL